MTQLTEIWIYPVKSLGGIPLDSGVVLKKGLQHDRRWMLIDGQGTAMTQRVYPHMALFKPEIQGNLLHIRYKKSGHVVSSIEFNLSQASGTLTARIWGDRVDVCEVDAEISKWFAGHLGTSCRLVVFPEGNPRSVNPEYAVGKDLVSLADAYPFLIIGQSSLEDLNGRLDTPVPMNRFRPNFVFSGGTPFLEDEWKQLRIGNVPFAAVKKSDRCVLTTVDQETAAKGAEPLRTLSRYRKVGNDVFFGQNLIGLAEGTVNVGDLIIPD